jgi:hypothetical protein
LHVCNFFGSIGGFPTQPRSKGGRSDFSEGSPPQRHSGHHSTRPTTHRVIDIARTMAPRVNSSATLVGLGGVVAFWMVWSVSSRLDRIGADVTALASGLAGLEGKVDLLTGQLRHAQPGGFHDNSPHGAPAGGGGGGGGDASASLSQATRALEEQLQRLSQGVSQVDRLKVRLETAVQLTETAFGGGAGGRSIHRDEGKDGGDGGGGGGAAGAVSVARRGGERGLKSESDFGRPANLHSSPPDNADEALWQQTIKMNPGDPLPLVGRAYHPWYSNADHSRSTT